MKCDVCTIMCLKQKLELFKESYDLQVLQDTDIVVLFEFLRGNLRKERLWKYILLIHHLARKYDITIPPCIDRVAGTYGEKTHSLHVNELALADHLLDALEFRQAALTSNAIKDTPECWNGTTGRMEVDFNMLDPDIHTLTYWIACGKFVPSGGEAILEEEGITFTYKTYAVQIDGDYVTKCTFRR